MNDITNGKNDDQHDRHHDRGAELTAFVLGELDETQAADVTRRLKDDDAMRREVESIRETVALMTDALAMESSPGLTDAQRESIAAGGPADDDEKSPVIYSFANARTLWGGVGLAAAACLAVAFVWPRFMTAREEPVAILQGTSENDETSSLLAGPDDSAPRRELGIDFLEKSQVEVADGDEHRFGSTVQDGLGLAFGDRAVAAKEVAQEAAAMKSTVTAAPAPAETTPRSNAVETGALSSKREATPVDISLPPAGARGRRSDQPGLTTPEGAPTGGVVGGGERRKVGKKRGAPGGGFGFGGGGAGRGGRASTADAKDGRRIENEIADESLSRDRILRGDIPNIELLFDADKREVERQEWNREAFGHLVDNPFFDPRRTPRSTFSIDVDTASYSNLRRHLDNGRLPPADAVRIEELINYFDYDYEPATGDDPFSVNVEIAACPWNAENRLVRVGLRGREVQRDQRPATSLVFLLDVSGSMGRPEKLPLVKDAMKLLVENLTADDRIAIVTYAGSSGVALPSTYCDEREKIIGAIDALRSGGSTNGASGIELAYRAATDGFIEDGVNRVILCTDGDFNVGASSEGELVRLIEEKRKTGVFLTILGFGRGNWQDARMEKLSGAGNGNFAYIDGIAEAKKVLVEEMSGTLVTIAKDVKIQVEFNPTHVGAYRLIGYANRLLADRDFADDTKDAGEIGAGHTVTALYEIVPPGTAVANAVGGADDDLVFQTRALTEEAEEEGADLMLVRLRYKEPDGDTSIKMVHPVPDTDVALGETSEDFRFAAAVAAFGMVLRDSPHKGDADYDRVFALAGAPVPLEASVQRAGGEMIEDFVHFAGIARPDLARAYAGAILELPVDDAALAWLVEASPPGRAGFEQALGLMRVAGDGEAKANIELGAAGADPVQLLQARLIATPMKRRAESVERSERRAEFLRLVEKARTLARQ